MKRKTKRRRPPAFYKGTKRMSYVGDRIIADLSDRTGVRGTIVDRWFAKALHETGYAFPWVVKIRPDKYQRGIKNEKGHDGTIIIMLEFVKPLED